MKFDTKTMGKGLIVLAITLIILLGFVKVNSDEKSAVICELTSEAGVHMSECPFHNDSSSWLILAAFGLSFAILSLGAYFTFLPKLKQKSASFKDIDSNELDDHEKKIYTLLKDNKGSMYQSELVKKAELSKVKVTRILDHLETKEIVERKRRGMTNIVVLK